MGRSIPFTSLYTLKCEEPIPPSASIVCINCARRTCSRCWSEKGLYRFTRVSSLLILRDACSAAAGVRCTSTACASVGCTNAVGRSFLFTACCYSGVMSLCPFRQHRLYQPPATHMQPQLECKRPALLRVSSAPTRGTLKQCSQHVPA